MAHYKIEKIEFTGKARNLFLGLSGLGFVLVIIGMFTNEGPTRFWASMLLGNWYFTAISVTAIAWVAINYIAHAGWMVALKRIPEAMGGYLPVGAVVFALMILFSFIPMGGEEHSGIFNLYKWLHLDSNGYLHGEYDGILDGKRSYLNLTAFVIRQLVYFGIWIFFWRKLRTLSLNEDLNGGIDRFNTSIKYAAAFVPLYALSFAFASYDWMMSLEPHWYSTMYGVNVFVGAFVGNFLIQVVILFILQGYGFMGYANNSHYHDLGKLIFGFSVFWTYTWVSQFLLIWYANLPEETPYYFVRMQGAWKYLFFANLFINFIFPFLALMMRTAKRTRTYLLGIVIVMLIGRYIDWYLAIMPGSAGKESGFGFYEIGFFLFFGGIFAFMVTRQLAKANLTPVNHPYLEESLHHEI